MASSVFWEIKNKNKNLPASSVFQKSGLRNTCLFFFSLIKLRRKSHIPVVPIRILIRTTVVPIRGFIVPLYRHDSLADKNPYRHDCRADSLSQIQASNLCQKMESGPWITKCELQNM